MGVVLGSVFCEMGFDGSGEFISVHFDQETIEN